MYQQKKEEPKQSNRLSSFIYFIIIVAAAYLLSDLAMEQAERNDILDLDSINIPVINQPLPELVVQLLLALIIFFIMQMLFIFIVALFKGRKQEIYDPQRDQWGRR